MAREKKSPAGATLSTMDGFNAAIKENTNEDFLALVKATQQIAALHRLKYLALVKEGFTTEQALELCKGLNPFKV